MKRKIIIAVIILIFTACVAYVVYISSPMVRMTVAYKLNAELFEKAAHGNEDDVERLVHKLNDTVGFQNTFDDGIVEANRKEDQERLYIIGYREEVESSAGGKELRYEWVYSETKPDFENKEMSSFRLEKTLGDGWYLYRWLGYIC
ncbi:hypothetical protein [Ruminococcus albus]|uniref:Uncharacterized protein n=1 Tax=Ruminococcus albus TaxID=1264 RepID=A0A1H7FNF8_RUMAL|nr:hypothetical protein [Ruminococcus albus]SEK27344.1 hypothetical protein SAMN05216469_101335 [Ruminococcus albus]